MYESSWNNVSRAEDSLWKIFAAYTALFAGLGIAIDTIGVFGFLFIMTIFSFAGVISSLITNSWFVRNMGIISNIEKEFLEFTDTEVIPKIWMSGKVSFLNRENWWITIALFFAVIVGIHIILLSELTWEEFVKLITLDVVGLIFVGGYWIYLTKAQNDFENQAPGKTIT